MQMFDVVWSLCLPAYAAVLATTFLDIGRAANLPATAKWVWAILVGLVPVLGMIAWYVTSHVGVAQSPLPRESRGGERPHARNAVR